MRFAGTWKQYSANAMSQLTVIAANSGVWRYFRWPYQAMVMKIFEHKRSRMVFMAPESYHGRHCEVRVAAIWLVRSLGSAASHSSDDTTAKPFAQSHIAQCTARLAESISWEVQKQSRLDFRQRFQASSL